MKAIACFAVLLCASIASAQFPVYSPFVIQQQPLYPPMNPYGFARPLPPSPYYVVPSANEYLMQVRLHDWYYYNQLRLNRMKQQEEAMQKLNR